MVLLIAQLQQGERVLCEYCASAIMARQEMAQQSSTGVLCAAASALSSSNSLAVQAGLPLTPRTPRTDVILPLCSLLACSTIECPKDQTRRLGSHHHLRGRTRDWPDGAAHDGTIAASAVSNGRPMRRCASALSTRREGRNWCTMPRGRKQCSCHAQVVHLAKQSRQVGLPVCRVLVCARNPFNLSLKIGRLTHETEACLSLASQPHGAALPHPTHALVSLGSSRARTRSERCARGEQGSISAFTRIFGSASLGGDLVLNTEASRRSAMDDIVDAPTCELVRQPTCHHPALFTSEYKRYEQLRKGCGKRESEWR